MSPRPSDNGFLGVLQLLHTARQSQRGYRGDGERDLSAPSSNIGRRRQLINHELISVT